MASMKHQLDTLRGVPLFSGCSKRELEKIARAGDEITRAAGSVLMVQDQPGHEAFVVLDGQVTIKRNNRKVDTIDAGRIVGELSLLDKGPRTASAICETDCTLLVLESRRFSAVLDEIPALSRKVMQSLASKIRDLDSKYYG